MSALDWLVLILTLLGIIAYGLYRSRGQKDLDGYFRDYRSMTWLIILFSIMGTQASAVTFLSAPGQAYTDGMRFVQYYFGLPLAMVVLCITFVPIFYRLKVFTAYEFLEQRFDLKTRSLTTLLFLIQRGLSTGISIYAPSIILSALLGWNIYWTNIFMGGLVIIYTVSGGARAVAQTQKLQWIIVFIGMLLAGWMVLHLLPPRVSLPDALRVAGKMGKMNIIDTHINLLSRAFWKNKYNLYSGIIGGFFLALSYFGTDQSQVGRYLTARSVRESRMGLLMNGLIKVPMQFLILLIGALLFSFYLFFRGPIFFNTSVLRRLDKTPYAASFQQIRRRYDSLNLLKKDQAGILVAAMNRGDSGSVRRNTRALRLLQAQSRRLRVQVRGLIKKALPGADRDDTNYIFLHFVLEYLPRGLIGLLIAVIFLSAWGSIAASLNSLASASVIDLYRRILNPRGSESHYFKASRWFTLFWGLFSIAMAEFANQLGSLIQAVNVLGSLFYGTILGVFLLAFYVHRIRGHAAFWSALLSEALVILIYRMQVISFLWLNVIGCLLVLVLALLIQGLGSLTGVSAPSMPGKPPVLPGSGVAEET